MWFRGCLLLGMFRSRPLPRRLASPRSRWWRFLRVLLLLPSLRMPLPPFPVLLRSPLTATAERLLFTRWCSAGRSAAVTRDLFVVFPLFPLIAEELVGFLDLLEHGRFFGALLLVADFIGVALQHEFLVTRPDRGGGGFWGDPKRPVWIQD